MLMFALLCGRVRVRSLGMFTHYISVQEVETQPSLVFQKEKVGAAVFRGKNDFLLFSENPLQSSHLITIVRSFRCVNICTLPQKKQEKQLGRQFLKKGVIKKKGGRGGERNHRSLSAETC